MVRVTLRVRPGARVEKVELQRDGGLLVHVRAPAVDGRATEATLQAVANALGLRPWQVTLLRGAHTRSKLVEVELASPDELRRLERASGQGG